MTKKVITLLTDFGTEDGYVGVMKGVIAGINPDAVILDITHDIPAQDVDAAAFVLFTTYRYFPKGSVHVIVVDPGVGSARRAIGVQAGEYFFVAPDNGVLKYVFIEFPDARVFHLNDSRYFLPEISATFHGRDIFAPVAAHLSRGIKLVEMGQHITNFIKGKLLIPRCTEDKIFGNIIHIDHFGNAVTNISYNVFEEHVKNKPAIISAGGKIITGISKCYEEAENESALALWGSSGYLEIAVKGGSAQRILKLSRNQEVVVSF